MSKWSLKVVLRTALDASKQQARKYELLKNISEHFEKSANQYNNMQSKWKQWEREDAFRVYMIRETEWIESQCEREMKVKPV